MAITWLEQGATWNSAPPFIRNVGYEITARDAEYVTFKATMQIKINRTTTSAYYGYPIYWEINAGTDYKMKGTEKWYGGQDYRTFTITFKEKLGSASGNFSMKIRCWATNGGTMTFTKTYSVPYPAYNTAPVFPTNAISYIRENNENGGIVNNKIVGENVSNFYIGWSEATDVDNNIEKYEVWHSLNGSAFSKVSTHFSSTSFNHAITGGALTQGYTYEYYIKAVDTYGDSATLPTIKVTKNILTPATITGSEVIEFNTSQINVDIKSASNTNGNTTFYYEINSDAVTVYNKSTFTGVIKIVDTNLLDSTPYILRSDLQEYFKNKNFKGSLPLTITTTNKYGSKASTTGTIPVDLQTPPNPPTSIVVSEKVSTKQGSFIIPNRQRTRLTYSGATSNLGDSLVYSISYSIDNGKTFISLVNETPNTSILMDLPSVKVATPITFRVVTKSVETGKSSIKDLTGETLHFYNQPTVTLLNPERTSNTFSVEVKTVINTSIPNVKLGTQNFTGYSGAIKSFSGAYVTITDTGLNEEASYNLYVASNDDTGLSNVVTSIWVNQAKPVFSVRENGVGVGCVNSGEYALEINGGIKVTGESFIEGLDVDVSIPNDLNINSVTVNKVKATNTEFNTLTIKNGSNSLVVNTDTLTVNNKSVLQADSASNHIWINRGSSYSGLALGGYMQIQDGSGSMNYKTTGIDKAGLNLLYSDSNTLDINRDYGHSSILMWGNVAYKPKGTYYTPTQDINLRLSASWSGTVHRVAKKGEKLLVTGTSGSWSIVDDNGKVCYAPTEHLTKVATLSQYFLDEDDEILGEIQIGSNGIHCNDIYLDMKPTASIYTDKTFKERIEVLLNPKERNINMKLSQSEVNALILEAIYSIL